MNMRVHIHLFSSRLFWVIFFSIAMLLTLSSYSSVKAETSDTNRRLITVYDRGIETSFISDAKTLKSALDQANITLDPRDTVEPSRDEELVAPEYKVNIYRARPVIVVDGSVRTKVMTPYQIAGHIAKDAAIPLYPEDGTTISQSADYVGDGAGLVLTIQRSIPFTLDLYGRKTETRTRGATIAEMLDEKNIVLGANGRVSLPLETRITAGLEVRVWREGIQTITVDETINFTSELIYDADRPLGYKEIQTVGSPGITSVSYQIEIKEGQEISRAEIARIVTKQPVKQVVAVGIKGMGQGLTKAKGAIQFTDSKGVTHRETYYDLNMRRVMQSCGQGGYYSVRVDGAKIDADGYVIIAANYARYPKCSVVETSLGPGKVYDTGGFALHHPDGFDLATDWSRADGI